MSTKKSYKTLKQFVNDIERDLMFQIIMNMKHGMLSTGQAQKIAQEYLAMMPVKDKKHVLKHIKQMADTYKEAREVYMKYSDLYYEEKKDKTLKKVSMYLKKNNIEKAVSIMKGGIV